MAGGSWRASPMALLNCKIKFQGIHLTAKMMLKLTNLGPDRQTVVELERPHISVGFIPCYPNEPEDGGNAYRYFMD
jgi:hypothetical protein